MDAAKQMKPITLEEFEAMEKQERYNYELIDGIVMMSPSPSREHQEIGTNILITLGNQLAQTPCKPIYELDIKYNNCVYKPDLMVFCDQVAELPEIIFEILSPSTRHRDLRIKVVKYEEMGIKEYWIIDPKVYTVTVHDFVNHTAESYGLDETIYSMAQPKIVIPVSKIFVKKK